jgi:hypothetical protein
MEISRGGIGIGSSAGGIIGSMVDEARRLEEAIGGEGSRLSTSESGIGDGLGVLTFGGRLLAGDFRGGGLVGEGLAALDRLEGDGEGVGGIFPERVLGSISSSSSLSRDIGDAGSGSGTTVRRFLAL